MEHRYFSENYSKIGADLIDQESSLQLLRGVNIVYLHSDSESAKNRAEVDIMPQKYRCFADVVVTLFDSNIALFNDEQIKILIFQQLLKLEIQTVKEETRISTKDFDLEDFKTIINRFGTEWDSVGPELPFDDDEAANDDSPFEIFE